MHLVCVSAPSASVKRKSLTLHSVGMKWTNIGPWDDVRNNTAPLSGCLSFSLEGRPHKTIFVL